MRLVMLGLPGAGKGTQADLLAKKLNIPRISTGDMFREALQSESELGRQVKRYVERGELVPDDLTVALVEERIKQPDAAAGFILDGFPRTVPQAQALKAKLAEMGKQLDAAVFIDVPQEEAVRRISQRRVCAQCGATFRADAAEVATGKCSSCGGPLVQRSDDNEETARRRLQVYMDQTLPVVDFYRAEERLVHVDGCREVSDVLADILAGLERFGLQWREGGDS